MGDVEVVAGAGEDVARVVRIDLDNAEVLVGPAVAPGRQRRRVGGEDVGAELSPGRSGVRGLHDAGAELIVGVPVAGADVDDVVIVRIDLHGARRLGDKILVIPERRPGHRGLAEGGRLPQSAGGEARVRHVRGDRIDRQAARGHAAGHGAVLVGVVGRPDGVEGLGAVGDPGVGAGRDHGLAEHAAELVTSGRPCAPGRSEGLASPGRRVGDEPLHMLFGLVPRLRRQDARGIGEQVPEAGRVHLDDVRLVGRPLGVGEGAEAFLLLHPLGGLRGRRLRARGRGRGKRQEEDRGGEDRAPAETRGRFQHGTASLRDLQQIGQKARGSIHNSSFPRWRRLRS